MALDPDNTTFVRDVMLMAARAADLPGDGQLVSLVTRVEAEPVARQYQYEFLLQWLANTFGVEEHEYLRAQAHASQTVQ